MSDIGDAIWKFRNRKQEKQNAQREEAAASLAARQKASQILLAIVLPSLKEAAAEIEQHGEQAVIWERIDNFTPSVGLKLAIRFPGINAEAVLEFQHASDTSDKVKVLQWLPRSMGTEKSSGLWGLDTVCGQKVKSLAIDFAKAAFSCDV